MRSVPRLYSELPNNTRGSKAPHIHNIGTTRSAVSFTFLPFYPSHHPGKEAWKMVDYEVALDVAAKRKISLLPGIESWLSILWPVTELSS
jgi:hypothetical protein